MTRAPLAQRETATGGLERFGFALLHAQAPALDDVWRRVLAGVRPCEFWHRHEWHVHYARWLADADLHFVVVYDYERPIGILPLRAGTRLLYGVRLRVLELPTHPHMPLSDVIVDTRGVPPDLFARLARFLARAGIAWDAMMLQNVAADSAVLRLLDRAPARHLAVTSRRYDCVAARGGYEVLARSFTSKTRENLRRARRRLAEAGSVEYVSATAGAALAQAFAAFVDVEASGWKGRAGAGTAIKLDPRLLAFYQGLLHAFAPEGGCQINLLKLDGRVIAAQFCLVVDDVVYALKIGYDEAYAKLSPGKLLLDEMLRRALAARRRVNLTSSAAWHADWQPRVETAFKVTIFGPTPRARLAYAAARSDAAARALYRQCAKPVLASLRQWWRARRRRAVSRRLKDAQ